MRDSGVALAFAQVGIGAATAPPDDYWQAPTEIPEGADAEHITIDPVQPGQPARLITPAQWPDEAPPPVDWLADQRIPRGDVTTLHGDGGAGKTDLSIQLAEGVARGAEYWLGHRLAQGRVVIISAKPSRAAPGSARAARIRARLR